MAAKLLKSLATTLSSFLISLSLLGGLGALTPILVHAAPYGTCAYSTTTYNGTADCNGGSLTGTGQNWQYLLYAAIGLVVGVSAVVVMIVLLKKRSNNRSAPTAS